MAELEVAGIRVMETGDQPVLLLRQRGSSRLLPVWVDAVAAATLVGVVDGDSEGVPHAVELFSKILGVLGEHSLSGEIIGWHEGVFSAQMLVDGQQIEGRLSDIAALSVVLGFPLSCPDELLGELGVKAFEDDSDVVEEFKSFLDNVDPGDFE